MPISSDFDPDPTTLAVVRALIDRHRAEGLPDAAVRRKILDELREAFPEEAFDVLDQEAVIAMWQRAIDRATEQAR